MNQSAGLFPVATRIIRKQRVDAVYTDTRHSFPDGVSMMKTNLWAYPIFLISLATVMLPRQVLARCPLYSQAVNDSNSVIMLGGTARGHIRQFVVGEFGKDVDLQKRMLGQFDRCGALTVADIFYDKREGNVILSMAQHLEQVNGEGWLAEYQMSVRVQRDGREVEVNNKQGMINYLVGIHGNIISASDTFTNMGNKGFTETTYRHDKQFHLINSVARGSDVQSNGEYYYRWNQRGQMLSMTSTQSKEAYTYDKQGRELQLNSVSHRAGGLLTTINECQLWDETGNCTLSYSSEIEVSDAGTLKRHAGAAYRFDYWDKTPTPAN